MNPKPPEPDRRLADFYRGCNIILNRIEKAEKELEMIKKDFMYFRSMFKS